MSFNFADIFDKTNIIWENDLKVLHLSVFLLQHLTECYLSGFSVEYDILGTGWRECSKEASLCQVLLIGEKRISNWLMNLGIYCLWDQFWWSGEDKRQIRLISIDDSSEEFVVGKAKL